MRIAHLADSHLDESQDLQDNVRVHLAALGAIRDAEPDVIFHAGDVHNRKSSPEVREAGFAILDQLAEIAPLVIVRGNHDIPLDLLCYAGRRSKHPIHVFERPGKVDIAVANTRNSGVRVLALPWIDKAHLAATIPGTITETNAAVEAATRTLLDTMRAWALKPGVGMTVGLGHLTIGGSVLSTGQVLIGKGVELNAGDLLRTGAGLWALGHIHARQDFNDGHVNYSGSVQRLTFGDPEPKGWLLYECEHVPGSVGGIGFSTTFVELPARKIERFEWSLEEVRDVINQGETLDRLDGIRVRVRFPVRPDELAALDVQALEDALHDSGAAQVKLEPILQHTARVRSAEIGKLVTAWARFAAWLETREIELSLDARRRLEEKLAKLMEGGVSC